ncbi:MAG: extracellular solute-binding protein [Anaerolineae bacterium]|nr:extracellular solute-binding protein [Anaerolineae bacterium]
MKAAFYRKNVPAALVSVVLAVVLALVNAALSPVAAQGNPPITVWTKFNDQNPQNTQDEWLAAALNEYRAETGSEITNVFQPFDQINALLNAAVQSGADVPDVSYVDSQFLGFLDRNGVLTDLTEWAKGRPWFADVEPAALAACTTPDGRIVCIPTTVTNHFTYYWTGFFPDGYPADTEAFLEAAARIKAENPENFAFAGKLAEYIAVERFYYGLIRSFGGDIVDGEGRAAWANDAVAKTVEFARALVQNGYTSDLSLAPGFDFETPFKQGDAASFVAGSYSYVYLAPLTSPGGTDYAAEVGAFDPGGLAVGDALEAGELGFAPPLAAPGSQPYSVLLATGWAIPEGAANPDAARAFIDFQMTTARNVAFAVGYGALPSMISGLADEAFQTPYWKGVAEYQQQYGVGAPALVDYQRGMTILAESITRLITDPSLDILAELQAAQDDYNAG